jgi:UDP-N-acetylmuramate: L-alanyl-gamma-D-glutamyl-meso-diaminopimelate ligase
VLAVSADFPDALDATSGTRARRFTFGLSSGDFRAVDIENDEHGAVFSIASRERPIAHNIRLPTPGRMNVANALGVWVLLKEFGLSDRELAGGLENFNGIARRQQVVGEAAGILVVDDFAHHPTAIRATLQALAEHYPGRRMLAAFEPRSNTARRSVFQAEFAEALTGAARVYLAPVYFKENDPIPPEARLDIGKLMEAISTRGAAALACSDTEEVAGRILADSRTGDLIVCMSNGPFGDLPNRLLEALRRRSLD